MSETFAEIIGGLGFPEGPVWMPDGSILIVELAAGTVCRVSPGGQKQVIATPGGSPNGAALGPDGYLYVCNSGGFTWARRDGLLWPTGTPDDYSGGRIERVNIETGKVERLYETCNGHPLSGPNDIVFDAHGGFWFSDHGKRRARHVECGGLYYAKADGSLIREVVYPLVTANGVGLSPDGRTVYVAETDTGHIWAWDIMAPGTIARDGLLPGRHLAGAPGFKAWDSMAVTRDGTLHIASLFNGGITSISPLGADLGFLPLPDPLTTNICFDAAEHHAFVTLSGSGRLVKVNWRKRQTSRWLSNGRGRQKIDR
ncbi:SMP-30/gluconolactonase/LRE family protein [Aestuariivirga sp.]|uniref:SMP-30/gluconolactonase/LRE family protein n=1 Tax=Aestuariivirga sp. TaxID=2650926 RepID=UPI00359391BF